MVDDAGRTDWELLARYFSPDCNAEDIDRVRNWLKLDAQNKKSLELLEEVWNTPGLLIDDRKVNEYWQELALKAKIMEPGNLQPKKKWVVRLIRKPTLLKYAAVFLILLVLSLYFMLFKTKYPGNQYLLDKEIQVKRGEQKEVVLCDGSMIILDSGSILKYPSQFSRDKRRVEFIGEGYFTIRTDSSRPFYIYTQHAVVKVPGTALNLRTWPESKQVEVVVAEGTVLFFARKNKDKIPGKGLMIKKGQISILPVNGKPSNPLDTEISQYTAWMKREKSFSGTAAVEILKQMERWYNITFICTTDIPLSDKLSIHLTNKPLEKHLVLLATLMNIQYKREGNIVYLFK